MNYGVLELTSSSSPSMLTCTDLSKGKALSTGNHHDAGTFQWRENEAD